MELPNKMAQCYKTLNCVQTQLITWGDPFCSVGKDVIVCITGNPGVTDFYIEFGSALEKNTGLPVCVIGHAGHEEVSDQRSNTLRGQEHLFNLDGQTQHKLDLIDNCIDKSSKIHLIGHSIGAWLILELLQNNKHLIQRISSINLLFPTVQKMAETKNGVYLNNYVRRFHKIVIMLFTFLHFLPLFITMPLLNIYLKLNSLPTYYTHRILKYINPKVGEKVLFMGYDEMDNVREFNKEAVAGIKHLTNVIYSPTDNWAPLYYMDNFKQFQPPLQMKEVDVDHSFVLKSSERVAEMVSEFINTKINSR